MILKVIQYNFQNNAFTKKDHSDLNFPRQEISNGGLESVVTLLVRWENNFSSARIGCPIQLYCYLPRVSIPATAIQCLVAYVVQKHLFMEFWPSLMYNSIACPLRSVLNNSKPVAPF